MRVALILIVALGASAQAATPPARVSASDLDRKIDVMGATQAAQSLSEAQLSQVLSKAATGDPRWLQVIVHLRDGTDAAAREGVDQTLSMALQTNPSEVLALVRSHPDLPRVDWLCTDRAIEPSVAADRRFRDKATRAVRTVRAPALRSLRDQCLAALAS